MPSFNDLKTRAVSVKNSAAERAGNFRDKHTSVSSEKLDIEARQRQLEERAARGPPPSTTPNPRNAAPPPVHGNRPSVDANSSTRGSVGSSTPARPIALAKSPPPVVPRSAAAPPPPVVKHTSRPDVNTGTRPESAPHSTIPKPRGDKPPAPPSRKVLAQPAYVDEPDEVPDRIDWRNLSPEDKEVFFGWLDEFFSAYLKVDLSSHKHTVAPPRPSLPSRKTTTETAPVTKAHFGSHVDALKAQLRPTLTHHAESAPPLPGNRPAIIAATKPTYEPPPSQECIRCRDYSAPDAHAALFPREQVRSLANLGAQLAEPFDALVDKARAIFTWLHHNIAYDAASFLSGNVQPSTPEHTLRSGLAVCEGYAGLYARLALSAGLECVSINGHGKGWGYAALPPGAPLPAYNMNHAWNAVKLDDGEWKLLDSCWGAGALLPEGNFHKRFDPFMFTMPNEVFGLRHFPEQREPWKQYVAQPLMWEEYITLPEPPRAMLDLHQQGFAADLLQPDTLKIPPGRHTFYLKKSCEHIVEDVSEEYVPIMMSQRAERTPLILDTRRGGWSLDVDVVSGECVRLGYIKEMNGRDARGAGPNALQGFYGSMNFGVYVEWEVE